MTPDGKSMFLANCHQYGGFQLRGSVEVLSRRAVETLLSSASRCQDELDRDSWSEGRSVQECLELLQVDKVFDQNILAEKECWPATCWDKTKVAFHDNFED